jgi:hypothetical protein
VVTVPVILSAAKNLSEPRGRFFAALRMTGETALILARGQVGYKYRIRENAKKYIALLDDVLWLTYAL